MIDTKALRNKILDLAISGKLTEQLPEDGNAEDLYTQIQEEKEKLIFEGKIKKVKPLPPIDEEEIPYSIPNTWRWVRLVDIGAGTDNAFADGPFGSNLKREHYTEEKQVRIIQLSNVGERGWKGENEKYTTFEHLKTIQRSEVKCGNIVIAKMMPAGRAIIVPDVSPAYVLSSDCVKVVPNPILNSKYICYAINSSGFHDQVMKDVHGIGRERTSLSHLKTYLIPLPPLEEQERIVSVVEDAFAVIDRIEKAQESYFADQEVLKNKIIDAGIRGKLTEQLPEDGDAEDLYVQIQEEKAKLISEGKIKKEKPLPPITKEEIPFDIPKNWKWVRLGDISAKITSGSTPAGGKRSNAYVDNGYCFFREQNIYNDGIHKEGLVYISEELLKTRTNSMVIPNDILLNITGGSIGRCALIPDNFSKGSINQHILIIRMVCEGLRFFAHLLLCSEYGQKYIKGNAIGDKEGFSAGRCKQMLIPLPPLSEQKRIIDSTDSILKTII